MTTQSNPSTSSSLRIRDLGYTPGNIPTGPANSILDVPGVGISQIDVPTPKSDPTTATSRFLSSDSTKPSADENIRGPHRGLTVLLPRPADQIHNPCHAGISIFNGNGELTGIPQIRDWGFTNTPLCLTNSMSLGSVINGAWDYMLEHHQRIGSTPLDLARNYGTPVVAETADWLVNGDVARSRLADADVRAGFADIKTSAQGGVVREGSFGGGAGMTCHQFLGGTGTASRVIAGPPGSEKSYTLGALAQTNYGGRWDLQIGGVPIGRLLLAEKEKEQGRRSNEAKEKDQRLAEDAATGGGGRTQDGSIVVVLVTDAPLAPHQLERVARKATSGLAQVGGHGIGRTFSGDIFVALSTAPHPAEQLEHFSAPKAGQQRYTETYAIDVVKNESVDAYFVAAAEATEEAILNSLVGARDGMRCADGTVVEGLPVERVQKLLERYLVKIEV